MGDLSIAKKMIDAASACGATYVKFQKWFPSEALTAEQYNAPHPNPRHSFGEPYGKHRENLEFDLTQHEELKQYAESKDLFYSCSVFDKTSAIQIIQLEPTYIKVPSQKNLNPDIIDALCKDYNGDIHISTGMTTDRQLEKLLNRISQITSLGRIVLYHATSSYPCHAKDLYLLRLKKFSMAYGADVKALGFSGHHNSIAPDMAAYTLGAQFIERHFTLDRTWKGTDQAASLALPGLNKLVRDLNNTFAALGDRPDAILDIEKDAYTKVKQVDAEGFDNA